ncbi:helix-turn-helix domain-containing protein [Streptomyces profundus]|uniref:helix-turn-helix domain-containing protein n=1 Tax=Streptomyces profundus TaxID=2867410 RepID=UPI001D15E96D|nr:helix-turn-helix transcriptional regulator [Streptomyces sp. MA3_2.13]UED85701.1 helix-turn-helix domain-containing protein [Streptomyces sp. MA3_2.13]
MARRPVTVRRYLLGMELRRLRTAAGVKQEAAAVHIDMDDSKMSRIENGSSPISRPELFELLRLYGVEEGEGSHFEVLDQLNREARKRGWWHHERGGIPPTVHQLIDLESSAASMVQFSPLLVPGLLQTEAYARALISSFPVHMAGGVDTGVGIRMKRQEVLAAPNPPHFICLLDEAALHRQIGGPKVHAEQLYKLVDVANPPTLTIQIVPYERGVHAGLDGGFTLFSYPNPISMEFAFIEYADGRVFIEEEEQVRAFRRTTDHLRAQALSSDESMRLISSIAGDLERQMR